MADTIAIVGGDTLLGQDLREVLSQSSLGAQVRLVASEDEEPGKLTQIDGGAAFLAKLQPDAVQDAAAVVLAGSSKDAGRVLGLSPEGLIVDLTYTLEDEANARLRAPLLPAADDDASGATGESEGPQILAHPASLAIAILLDALHKAWPVARSLIHVFEPASERGKAGIDELQQQTVNLLSFQPLPKNIYDTQLSFGMLPQLGEEAPVPLLDIEERIERHLATLLDRLQGPPLPSLRLIQAPVFHGYSFSVWIEFEDAPSASEIEEALNGAALDVRGRDLEPPNNVSMAGQSGISIGAIAPDRNSGSAFWIWMAVDNLRLMADAAAALLRSAL